MSARRRMLAGLPVSERRVSAGGVSTSLLEGGEGPPLLLLHGAIECGGAVWAPVAARLAASHRIVIPDLPGLGESEPFARLDAGLFSDWFADLLRETCPEAPTMVVHSASAAFALRFAAENDGALRRLVVCAGPAVGPFRMPLRLRVLAIRFALRPTPRNGERFDRFALLDLDRTRGRDREWFDAFAGYTLARARERHVKRTMGRLVALGTRQVPDPELRRIAVPVELAWGRHDRMVPLAIGEGASARLGWPLRVIDDAAHAPQIEQPEAFLEALESADRLATR